MELHNRIESLPETNRCGKSRKPTVVDRKADIVQRIREEGRAAPVHIGIRHHRVRQSTGTFAEAHTRRIAVDLQAPDEFPVAASVVRADGVVAMQPGRERRGVRGILEAARGPDRRRDDDLAHATDVRRRIHGEPNRERADAKTPEGMQFVPLGADGDTLPGVDEGAVNDRLVVGRDGSPQRRADRPGIRNGIGETLFGIPEDEPHQSRTGVQGNRRGSLGLTTSAENAQHGSGRRSLGRIVSPQRHADREHQRLGERIGSRREKDRATTFPPHGIETALKFGGDVVLRLLGWTHHILGDHEITSGVDRLDDLGGPDRQGHGKDKTAEKSHGNSLQSRSISGQRVDKGTSGAGAEAGGAGL